MYHISIFASGNGSNAEAIIHHFRESELARVELILTNKQDAFVIERAVRNNKPAVIFSKTDLYDSDAVMEHLSQYQTDIVVLAGFLWLIPFKMLQSYPGRIINIHPALLPEFGGRGMYGSKVHEAVIRAGKTESGITIHLIDHEYDKGKILFQAKCPVYPDDTAETLAKRIHGLEYQYFPGVIDRFIRGIRDK